MSMAVKSDPAGLSDADLAERCLARDEDAIRELTRRYNQRLYRIARGILRSDLEAEDVVQETYIRALAGLERFRGQSALGTWLVRIAVNEALGRLRRKKPEAVDVPAAPVADPETLMATAESRRMLERAIDDLPVAFRCVFMARMVEGLSIEETADLFGLRPETVKTRVHRARARLRAHLETQLGPAVRESFAFDGARCDRVTNSLIRRLRQPQ